jgi:hypothetical protein
MNPKNNKSKIAFPPIEYSLCVQCENASDGRTGDFVARIDGKKRYAVSPLFSSLAELFPWMREHGWKLDEGCGDNFRPWRVVRA